MQEIVIHLNSVFTFYMLFIIICLQVAFTNNYYDLKLGTYKYYYLNILRQYDKQSSTQGNGNKLVGSVKQTTWWLWIVLLWLVITYYIIRDWPIFCVEIVLPLRLLLKAGCWKLPVGRFGYNLLFLAFCVTVIIYNAGHQLVKKLKLKRF